MRAIVKKHQLFLAALFAISLGGCAAFRSPPVHGPAKASFSPVSYSETLSLAATGTTVGSYTGNATTVGVFLVSTGTASGTYTVEYSADNVTWDTYTLSTTPPAAAGSPQTFGITLQFYEFPWYRIRFTRTGGTGSATVKTTLK